MATRTKTVEYGMPPLASMVDNTLTALTQITVYLPESGKTFRSVIAKVVAMGTSTATGNVTTRRLDCRLGAASYQTTTSSGTYTGSGEDIFLEFAADLTSHFTTNWTGTSMTFDASALMDGTGTGIAWTNICVTLYITYDYDDTSTTQVKTVRIPLDMPASSLATSKPGTALATIPDLSSELPEASKSFRNHFITVQGNIHMATGTTDHTLTFQLDSTTSHTTGVFEALSTTDYFFRYIWNAPDLNTAASMGWYAWANVADFDHLQAWITVTYEFDASASNDVFVSIMLPLELASPMGGTSSADYQRGERSFFIEEPGTITTKQMAFFAFWDQSGPIAGLNLRMGSGSFISYGDTATLLAGSNAAMIRNDSAFTLDRGRNVISVDMYRTDTTDLGTNISGFFIINYTADKPTDGYGAANHTILQNLGPRYEASAAALRTTSAVAALIADTEYFINAVGVNYKYITNNTVAPSGLSITVERLASGEDGLIWEPVYVDVTVSDAECGIHECYSQGRTLFKRWIGDPDPDRMDLETSRRWRAYCTGASVFDYMDLLVTYHAITSTVSGNISNSNGGTVNISLHREATGEKVLETSRVGNGAYSFTWYDDTENLYVEAYEDNTYKGRSGAGLATLD